MIFIMKWLVVMLLLVVIERVSSINLKKECIPKSKIDLLWEGSKIDLTFWLSEEDVRNPDTSSGTAPLSFLLQFHDTSMKENFDRITVQPSVASVYHMRDRKSTTITNEFKNSLRAGWNSLGFSSRPNIDILYNGTKILSYEPGKTIQSVEIRSTSVVVNCHQLSLIWPVTGEQEVTVPLDTSMFTHRLSLFSNTPTKPVIRLGSSDPLQLGWDGNSLADQIMYKKEIQSPIPASVEHNITLSCKQESDIACNFLVGNNMKSIKNFHFEKLPDGISFAVEPADQLFVSYHRPSSGDLRQMLEGSSDETADPGSPGSSDTGYIIGLVVLTTIAVCLSAGLVYFLYHKYNNTKRDSEDSPGERENFIKMEEGKGESTETLNNQELEMQDAIRKNDLVTVKKLYHKSERKEINKLRAHLLGKQKILDGFRELEKAELAEPSNDIIVKIYKELECGINEVFKAVKKGHYEGSAGVKSKLYDHQLPDTITDQQGCSILHHMVKFENGRPILEHEDIIDFLENREYFINAVDHEGNTALHSLAENTPPADLVHWKDTDMTNKDILSTIADMLIEKGADPSIQNHRNQLAEHIAKKSAEIGLETLLSKNHKSMQVQSKEDADKQFSKLVEKVKKSENENDRKDICQLLSDGVPLLPMWAQVDPLVEAIRASHRDTVFLLLGAGAPICNRLIDDLTPLDAAHNTLGLPACHAAILRKAICDRLATEKQKLDAEKDVLTLKLVEIIERHIEKIKKEGKEAEGETPKKEREDNNTYSKDVRMLLVKAASKGLSLTCVLLGQKDVYLHPLPREDNPFTSASLNHHTQTALCRDLGMVPFTSEGVDKIEDILSDLRYKEEKIVLQAQSTDQNIFTKAPSHFLMIAKHDLVGHLHDLFRKDKSFDKDQIVQKFSNCTMLHIAAMHGNIGVIEYLLYKEASLEKVTIGNYTAAHLAALGGHKEVFHYITSWMEIEKMDLVNVKCHIGLTALELMEKYESLCQRSKHPFMDHRDALFVINEIGDRKKAHEILFRKGSKLGIKSFKDFVKFVDENVCPEDEVDEIRDKVKDITEELMSNNSKFVDGKYIPIGPLKEGNELLDISHVDFIFEISEEMGSLKDREKIKLIEETFPGCVEDAMASFKDDSGCLSLAPPFLTHTPKGIHIRWVWNDKDTLRLLTSYIVPTINRKSLRKRCSIKEESEEELEEKSEEEEGDIKTQHFFNKLQKAFVPSTHLEDQTFFSKLDSSQKSAWLTCRMLRKLTQECWWAPTFKTQYYPEDWHTWSLGVPGLSETKLKQFFQAKINSEKESLFDRVIETYEDIVKKDKTNGKWIPNDANYHDKESVDSVCGILEYLNSLKSGE